MCYHYASYYVSTQKLGKLNKVLHTSYRCNYIEIKHV